MPAGRPRIEINWDQFNKLCQIQCSLREIANWFECSEDTIERACEREYQTKFAEYYAQKSSKGKIALRRKMYEVAMSGDKTMMIWLSKQYLGMSDKQEIKQETKNEDSKLIIQLGENNDRGKTDPGDSQGSPKDGSF